MRNRYNDRRYGYGRSGSDFGRSSDYGNDRGYGSDYSNDYDRGDFRGSSDYRSDERYFGGGRQYGEGYSSSPYQGRSSGDFGRNFGDDRDDWNYGESGRNRSFDNYGSNRDYDNYGYGDRGYGQSGYSGTGGYYTGGMFGGGIGGYSGGGYQGYNPGSFGTSDYDRGGNYGYGRSGYRSSYGRYGSNYPESERGYFGDRDRGYDRNERGWFDKAGDEVASWFGDEEAERRRRMDQRGGQHRGRGPKNYTRSDDRIKEDVNDRLTDSSFLDASEVDVEVNNGDVVLTGTVDSRYAKRMAEDLAEDCSGVKNVENRIRVDQDWGRNQYQTGTTSTTGSTTSTTDTKSRTATSS